MNSGTAEGSDDEDSEFEDESEQEMEDGSETEDDVGEEESEEGATGIGIAAGVGRFSALAWPIAMWTRMRTPKIGPHLKDYISISAVP